MIINIGKAVLYQMLGVQQNHNALINNLDITGNCKDCPWLLAALNHPTTNTIKELHNHCNHCPLRGSCQDIDLLSVEYINEKNRYGSKKKVCRNSILLFILLHTLNPSKNGFIKNVSVTLLAEKMQVNKKTVYNCMSSLVKNEYIYMDKTSTGTYNIILLDYPSYFLRSDKGGRGYIKLCETVIQSLLDIHSILAFRLILRQLLESDMTKSAVKSYKELRYSLPEYCKRNVIRNKLKDYCTQIYDIEMDINNVSFVLKSESDTKTNYDNELKEHEQYYSELLNRLEDFVLSYKPGTAIPSNLCNFLLDDNGNVVTPVLFQINGATNVVTILARLSCKYTRQIVTEALADTYRMHMCQNKGLIKNIGAYILEVIRSYGLLDGKPSKIDFSKINTSDANIDLIVA